MPPLLPQSGGDEGRSDHTKHQILAKLASQFGEVEGPLGSRVLGQPICTTLEIVAKVKSVLF